MYPYSNCIDYNCGEDIGEQVLNDCDEALLGGGGALILFDCNTHLTDPESATQINTELTAGRAHLFQNVKIGMAQPSPVQNDNLTACATQTLITYDRSFTLVDGNVNKNNTDVYNGIYAGKKYAGALIYICGTTDADAGPKTIWIDAQLHSTGGLLLPTTNSDFMSYDGTFTWKKKKGPDLKDAPVGIF